MSEFDERYPRQYITLALEHWRLSCRPLIACNFEQFYPSFDEIRWNLACSVYFNTVPAMLLCVRLHIFVYVLPVYVCVCVITAASYCNSETN